MELPGERKRGKTKRRFMAVVREDVQMVWEVGISKFRVWKGVSNCPLKSDFQT